MRILIAFFDENDKQRWVSFGDIRDFICMVDGNIPFSPQMEPGYEVAMAVVGNEVNTSLLTVSDVIDYARLLLEARCSQ